jgi:hypothetical protein
VLWATTGAAHQLEHRETRCTVSHVARQSDDRKCKQWPKQDLGYASTCMLCDVYLRTFTENTTHRVHAMLRESATVQSN